MRVRVSAPFYRSRPLLSSLSGRLVEGRRLVARSRLVESSWRSAVKSLLARLLPLRWDHPPPSGNLLTPVPGRRPPW